MSYQIINIHEAKKLFEENKAIPVDIRDPQSFNEAHISKATHISDQNLKTFIDSADKDKPIICYCYHGISSQNASQFLIDQGFTAVYSLEGGFEAWREVYESEAQ